MKKVFSILTSIFVLCGSAVFADDAFVKCYRGGAGTVRQHTYKAKIASPDGKDIKYELSESTDISMDSEHVAITLYDDYYTIDAKFYLTNNGDEQTVEIGFPENINTGHGTFPLSSFETFVDGRKTKAQRFNSIDSGFYDSFWYVKKVHFAKEQTVETRVKYKCDYGGTSWNLYFGYSEFLTYVYGTGKSWKGAIGKITVDVTNKTFRKHIMEIEFLGESVGNERSYISNPDIDYFKPLKEDAFSFKWISPDTFRLEAENVEPQDENESISLLFQNFCTTEESEGWNSSSSTPKRTLIEARKDFTKLYIQGDLCFMTEKQLRFARNDFYASHGRKFNDKELRDFYEKIYGYEINQNYIDSLLSNEDKKIIEKIVTIENERKSSY